MGVQATPVLDKTYKAAGDISASVYRAVRFSADYTVDVATTNVQVPCGILQNEPAAAGRGARVRHLGTSIGVAGAAFAAGVKVMVAAGGKLIAATTAKEAVGIATQAALADGDQFEVLLTPGATQL